MNKTEILKKQFAIKPFKTISWLFLGNTMYPRFAEHGNRAFYDISYICNIPTPRKSNLPPLRKHKN